MFEHIKRSTGAIWNLKYNYKHRIDYDISIHYRNGTGNIEVVQEEGYVDMTSPETRIQVGLTTMEKLEDHIYINDGWEEKGNDQGTQSQEDAVLYPGLVGWLGSGANATSTESSERILARGAEECQSEKRTEVKAEVHQPHMEIESVSEVVEVSTEEEDDNLSFR